MTTTKTTTKTIAITIVGAGITVISSIAAITYLKRIKERKGSNNTVKCSSKQILYEQCIGNTPLIYLPKLSSKLNQRLHVHGDETNKNKNDNNHHINVYVKMECLNPGGTGKDRAALFMLRHAEENGDLPPPIETVECSSSTTTDFENNVDQYNASSSSSYSSLSASPSHSKIFSISTTISTAISKSKTGGIVIEGTSGSTGISLATLSSQRGHSSIIVMPDDQAKEKQIILSCLGAVVHIVPTASISNPNHYVNVAKKIAEEVNKMKRIVEVKRYCQGRKDFILEKRVVKAAFMNQFENEANYNAHFHTTGPEIYQQSNGDIDVFCMSAGTGGTISGVGHYLKQKTTSCKECTIVLIDPPGSTLYNKVKYNIAYTPQQKERALLRHRYDTIAEGIGLDRITHNFAIGVDHDVIDDAILIQDQDAVDIAHWLLKEEGLFVGSSSAMNVAGLIRFSLQSANQHDMQKRTRCIVTVICDGGQRHLTRFWNRDFIRNRGLLWPSDDEHLWHSRLDIIFSSKT